MEKNTSKKLAAGIFALSCAFILAGCDPIESLPANYNDPIVVNTADDKEVELDDNIMGKIYDAIKSNKDDKVVSKILEELAINKFGSYKEIMDAKADNSKKAEFLEKHKDVFKRDDDSRYTEYGKTLEDMQNSRFENFVDDIEKRISEFFYNEINSGSYIDEDGKFDEEKLYRAHRSELWDFKESIFKDGKTSFAKFYVTGEITKDNAYDHLNVDYSNPDTETTKGNGYIENKVLPQILKDKLVEEYVFNNNYASLGRSYARKVNYLRVSYDSPTIPFTVLQNYADLYIEGNGNGTAVELDFEVVSKALKGFDSISDETGCIVPNETTSDAYTLASSAMTTVEVPADAAYKMNESDTEQLIPAGTYFKETKLGEIIVSYQKALKAEGKELTASAEDKAELEKFTADNKSKQYNLREKLINLAKEDYTTDGWFVKNGGLSELPSAVRDRLFNINVANTLDNGKLKEEVPAAEVDEANGKYAYGAYETDEDGVKLTNLPYARNMQGRKLVLPKGVQPYAEDTKYNYIYQDASAKAFFIVQILEAPSTPKLNVEGNASYLKFDTTNVFRIEEYARAIAKVLSTKDTYITNAYTKYLEDYDFKFNDTSLYEHFKNEYPDLFDDED